MDGHDPNGIDSAEVAISSRDLALPRPLAPRNRGTADRPASRSGKGAGPLDDEVETRSDSARPLDQRGFVDPELVDQHHQRRIDAERVAPRGERSELASAAPTGWSGGRGMRIDHPLPSRSVPRDEVRVATGEARCPKRQDDVSLICGLVDRPKIRAAHAPHRRRRRGGLATVKSMSRRSSAD